MILPINKELIPYEFEVVIEDNLFTFEIHYNGEHEFFTVDLRINDEVIAYGEKLSYNQRLFRSVPDDRLPHIVPLDPSGKVDVITYDNFTQTVFLQVIADAV